MHERTTPVFLSRLGPPVTVDNVIAQYDIIVFDFKKAFDKVSHRHLLRKLHASGVRGKLHQWMAAYLAQRTQRVVVDGVMSQEARVLSGVTQGTVLGPPLFLTCINDNITNDTKGQIRLFADDALLYHPIKTEADGCASQGDLNSLHRWSKRWKMAFNITTCHVLHITRNRIVIRHRYNIGGTLLTPVDRHPYVGLEQHNELCWKQQLANVRSKSTRTLNMVRGNFTKGTKSDIRNHIYTSLVRPVLEHGSLV